MILTSAPGTDSSPRDKVILFWSAISATAGATASAAAPVAATAVTPAAATTGATLATARIATSAATATLALVLALPGECVRADVTEGGLHRIWLIGARAADLAVAASTAIVSITPVIPVIPASRSLLARNIAARWREPCSRRAARAATPATAATCATATTTASTSIAASISNAVATRREPGPVHRRLKLVWIFSGFCLRQDPGITATRGWIAAAGAARAIIRATASRAVRAIALSCSAISWCIARITARL